MQLHDHSIITDDPASSFGPAAPMSNTAALPDKARSIDWVSRGVLVGFALGTTAGSIVPMLGTAFGAVFGTIAGLGIGLAMAVFAAVTRAVAPAGPSAIELRERIACLAIIWTPVIVSGPELRALAIPAALGSIHALAAGTPTRMRCYTGVVSPIRARVCNGLPLVIISIIAVGWTIALIVMGIREP
jgi:hypothetical protein